MTLVLNNWLTCGRSGTMFELGFFILYLPLKKMCFSANYVTICFIPGLYNSCQDPSWDLLYMYTLFLTSIWSQILLFLLIWDLDWPCCYHCSTFSLGDKVRLSWKLSNIKKLDGGGYILIYETPEGLISVRTKSVVITVPSYVASDLLRPLSVCSAEEQHICCVQLQLFSFKHLVSFSYMESKLDEIIISCRISLQRRSQNLITLLLLQLPSLIQKKLSGLNVW